MWCQQYKINRILFKVFNTNLYILILWEYLFIHLREGTANVEIIEHEATFS